MSDPWVGATFLIVIVLGALQGAYFARTDRRLAAMAEQELAGGATKLSDDYTRHQLLDLKQRRRSSNSATERRVSCSSMARCASVRNARQIHPSANPRESRAQKRRPSKRRKR